MKNLFFKALALAIPLMATVSCIDDRYDISDKEIDMTVNVGGDELALPIGSTSDITLDEILPLENTDYLVTDSEGNYSIVTEETEFDETITIDPVTFSSHGPSYADLDFGTIPATSGLPDEEFPFRLPEPRIVELEFDEITVDEMVEDIHNIEFEAVANATISLATDALERLRVDELSVTFPEWLVIEEGNRITIDGDIAHDSPLTHEININGIDLEKAPGMFDPQNHTLHITGEIEIDSEITISGGDINSEGGEILLDVTIDITSPTGSNSIEVTAVEGKIDIASEPTTESFDLGLDNEFLSEDYVLNLIGSSIYLEINNGTPLSASFAGKIETFAENGEKLAEATFETPEIMDQAVSRFRISENGDSDGEYAGVAVSNFDALMYRVPASISITFNANSSGECRIELGSEYRVSGKCHINAPIRFGEDLDIATDYTIGGIQDLLKKNNLGIDALILNATVSAWIPAKIIISADVTDASGSIVDGIDIRIDDGKTLEISGQPGGEVSRPISISIEQTIDGALLNADNIVVHARLTEGNGETMKTDNYISFKDISIIVPGGIDIDLGQDSQMY